jgi:hypothetical protein
VRRPAALYCNTLPQLNAGKLARHARDASGTILLAAHRRIEQITLDRGPAHLKGEMMPRYGEFLYTGVWCSPEREMLQALWLRRSGGYVVCKPANAESGPRGYPPAMARYFFNVHDGKDLPDDRGVPHGLTDAMREEPRGFVLSL